MTIKWGFIRETKELADKAGVDQDTGVCRTGLEEYLAIIFPDVDDWVHDKTTGLLKPNGKKSLIRPDYRSEQLKMIVEYDGLPHYSSPDQWERDKRNQSFYESYGYKVVRVPYFIQLTNAAVERLFGVKVDEPLFDGNVPSIGPKGNNTPAYLCPSGIRRMASEFAKFPDQYRINMDFMKSVDDYSKTEYKLLEESYNLID